MGVTSIRSAYLRIIMAIFLVAGLGQTALAHGVGAVVSFDPPVPAPGQLGTVQVKMLDAYGAVIPATMSAAVSAIDQPPPDGVALQERTPGIHTAQLRFPDTVGALLRLEVALPDGPTKGQMMFRVGEGGFAVQDLSVDLLHEGEVTDNGKPYGSAAPSPAPTPQPASAPQAPPHATFPWVPASVLLIAVLTATWFFIRRRR